MSSNSRVCQIWVSEKTIFYLFFSMKGIVHGLKYKIVQWIQTFVFVLPVRNSFRSAPVSTPASPKSSSG